MAGPAAQHVPPQMLLAGRDQVGPDGLLEGEDQAGPDGLDDGGGAALLARNRVVQVLVADGVDERHRASARRGRDGVADQVAADDQDAGGLRAAGELVRGQEHRILVVARARAGGGDLDRHVRPGGGVVPERQRPVGVQQPGDRRGAGQDAGHVGGGREAADQQRPVRVPVQLAAQVGQVDVAVGVLTDDHHLGDGLAPGQLVRVVLVRADEHHRPFRLRDTVGQPVPFVQPSWDTQLQDADQLVHRGGGPGPAEDHQVIGGAADRVADDAPGVLAQPGGRQAGAGALGVGVGVPGQHRVPDEILDKVQRPARGRVIGVSDPARPERAVHQLPLADDPPPDPLHQRRRHHSQCVRPDRRLLRDRHCCPHFRTGSLASRQPPRPRQAVPTNVLTTRAVRPDAYAASRSWPVGERPMNSGCGRGCPYCSVCEAKGILGRGHLPGGLAAHGGAWWRSVSRLRG